jgi:arylsulfatase A-like enzyme
VNRRRAGTRFLAALVGVVGFALLGCRGSRGEAASESASPEQHAPALPDILVVVHDTTGPGVVKEAMPNTQAFLEANLHFTNAWSGSNSTIEGTGAMFSGGPFWEERLYTELDEPGLGHRTLAQLLHDHGYATVFASSNPVLDQEYYRLGFDRFWVRGGPSPPPASRTAPRSTGS